MTSKTSDQSAIAKTSWQKSAVGFSLILEFFVLNSYCHQWSVF